MPVPQYGVCYQAGWGSRDGSLLGYLVIDKLDYVGAATDLVLSFDSIRVRYAFDDWNSPILGLQCEFQIENTFTDFFTLMPLLTAEEQEYRVRVVVNETETVPSYQLFEGFLNASTTTLKYLRYQNIKLSASNYLAKLDNFHPISIDTLQNMNFITVIQEMLASIGYYHHFKINCRLFAEGDILLPTQTLFNKNGFNTEIFWKDTVERDSCLVILKKILTTFDCYIYWWKGCWYIERYEDIWNETKSYVDYDALVSYLTPASEGTVVEETRAIRDVHDLLFIEQSQELHVIPGLGTIKINLDDNRLTNLTTGDLKDITATVAVPPLPDNRTWEYQTDANVSWINPGKAKNNIVNSIQRLLADPTLAITHEGLYTKFKTTIDTEETQINIQFKYVVNPDTIANYTGLMDDYQFIFNWYLKVLPLENYIFSTDDGKTWKVTIGSAAGKLQQVIVEGSAFDMANYSYDVSITIPLGDITIIVDTIDQGKLIGDIDLLFCAGVETVKITDTEPELHPAQAWIGDFQITSTGDNQNNIITGTANTKFLNKKDISLTLYDCESYNYLNAILRGDDYLIRTERWGVGLPAVNIVAKGVCWGPSENPVIAMSHTDDGTGTDAFTSIISGLSPGTTYYVRSYYTDAAGTTVYGNQLSFATLDLQVGSYYGGGQIGFFFVPGDEGYFEGEEHGLIVAYGDTSDDKWCDQNVVPRSVGASSLDVGDGITNTNLMLAETTNVGLYAAKKCGDYTVGAFVNWFLPSFYELSRIHANRNAIGGFAKTLYWSSSEKQDLGPLSTWWKFAAAVDFSKSTIYTSNIWWQKKNLMKVRPCRYF